jgi:hypothetical protein
VPNIGTNYTSHKVSTQVQQGSPYFGKSTITVVYRVNWTGATVPGSPPPGIDLPYGLDLVLAEAGVLPKIDTAYPAPGSGSSTWQQTALVRSITAVPQQQYIDVTVVYDTMYFYSATAKKNVSGTVSAAAADVYLPARTVYQSARRSANAWRGNWATNPPAGSDSTTDIGGSMISAGKTPQRIDVAQMKIRMKLLVDTAIQTPTDITAAAIAYVGKRNRMSSWDGRRARSSAIPRRSPGRPRVLRTLDGVHLGRVEPPQPDARDGARRREHQDGERDRCLRRLLEAREPR